MIKFALAFALTLLSVLLLSPDQRLVSDINAEQLEFSDQSVLDDENSTEDNDGLWSFIRYPLLDSANRIEVSAASVFLQHSPFLSFSIRAPPVMV